MGRGKWGEGGDSPPVDTGLEGMVVPEGLEGLEGMVVPDVCLMVLTETGLGREGGGEEFG